MVLRVWVGYPSGLGWDGGRTESKPGATVIEFEGIFIDTSEWLANNFDFSSRRLRRLSGMISRTDRTLLVPTIIRHEIDRHLRKKSEEAIGRLTQATRLLPQLRSLLPNFVQADGAELIENLYNSASGELGSYLSECDAVVLSADTASLEQILVWYASGEPPFGDGKKKAEFPDAVALSALLAHAARGSMRVAVVSRDTDWRRATGVHDSLVYFDCVDSLLAHEAQAMPHDWLDSAWHSVVQDLESAIEESFEELFFMVADQWEGEVEDVRVREIELMSREIIEIDEESAVLSFRAQISFSCHVSYPDYGSAMGSSRDGWFALESVELDLSEHRTMSGTVIVLSNGVKEPELKDLEFDDTTVEVGHQYDEYD